MKKPTKRATSVLSGSLSLEAAARRLGITTRELRRRLGRGDTPFVQVRGRIRVPKQAIAEKTGLSGEA